MKKIIIPIILAFTIFSTMSCSSTYVDISAAETSYYYGHYDAALAFLRMNANNLKDKQGPIVYNLDYGIINHSAKNYQDSIYNLADAERAIEENFSKSISANVGSFLLNESVRDYNNAFYEDIYTNIFLALNYYHLGNIEDSMVEVRRSLEKLQLREKELPILKAEVEKQIADNKAASIDFSDKVKAFDSTFVSSALSYFLSSLFSFEYGDYDTFRISREKGVAAYKLLNKYYMEDNYTAFQNLGNANRNSTMINFLAFSGYAPTKITQIDKNVLVVDDYVDDDGVYHPPYYADVVYTIPKIRGTSVSRIEVNIDGRIYYLQPFENIELIALESLEQNCSAEYFRAYFRAVSREITKSVVDSASVEEGSSYAESSLFSDIYSIFSMISEGQGDLRTAHFFPAMSWIGSFMIDPGTYNIGIKYFGMNNNLLHEESFNNYEVKTGKANLLESIIAK